MKNCFAGALCVLSCIFLLPEFIYAQTSVQIGTGTSVNTGSTASLYAPICRVSSTSGSDFSRSNILYTATELTTAGITNGLGITKIAFYKVGTGASVEGFPFKVYMRNSNTTAPMSTATTWANILSTHTLVYERAKQHIPDATGWIEFTLDMPFQYTGQNVEIAFESDMSAIAGNPTTGPFDWQYSTGFADYIIGVFSTTLANVATLSGTTAVYKQRPNIRITYNNACGGAPVAGEAVKSNPFPVCPGTSVQLNLANHVPSLGLSYTWQSSSTLNGTYTNISSPSSSSAFTVAPSSTTFYRASVACGGSVETSVPVEVVVVPPLNGNYTIDPLQPPGISNFQSFAQALTILKCGIAGPVVFNVAGTAIFNEMVSIDSIPGASPINTVTFKGNGATITSANTSSSERAVVKLNGANYVTIDSFIINPTGATYGFGVQLLNDADSNVIRNCIINIPISSSSFYSGILITPTAASSYTTTGVNTCDGNLITGNKIDGGYVGISIVADGNSSMVYNNKLIGNTITNFYSFGIYINGNDGTVINGNDISRPTRTSITVFNGIYFTSNSQNCVVTKNRIHNTFDGNTSSGSSNLGIYFTNCDATAGNENIVSNNLVYKFSGTGIHYALYNSGSDYVKFYHNSVDLDNTTPSGGTAPTRAFYQANAAVGVEVKNNILRVTREGTSERWALYFSTTGVESNNNVVYVSNTSGSYIGYFNSANQLALSDWITASGQDVNSKQEDPLYTDVSAGNLLPTNAAINDIGVPVGVTTDILGNSRSLTAPDPGAYEFSGSACVAPPNPGNIVVAGVMPVCQGAEIALNLENNSIGEGQTYQWMSSDTENGVYTNISDATASTGLVINPTVSKWYKAAVTCSGNTQLTAAVQIVVQPAFPGGVYTINATQPTGGSNFQSFGDAVSAISCGITSAITFNVVPGSGPYSEQVIIPEIPGSGEVNTITFNGNGNTVGFLSANTAERAVIKLNGTDYVRINNLFIQTYGNGASEYGFGIQLTNDADHNIIRGCTIETAIAPATAGSTSFAGIVLSGLPTSAVGSNSGCDYNIIDSNTISGGYYGITAVGASNQFVTGNQFIRNTVKDFYQYGIYVAYSDSVLVEKNDISRPLRTSVNPFYGVHLVSGATAATISKNKIHNPFDGAPGEISGFFGVNVSGADGTLSKPNLVVNNLIYNAKSNGPLTAFNHSSSDYVKYYHNTISFDDQASAVTNARSTSALFLSNDDPGVEFKNNVISITRSGNSLVRAIYIGTTTPVNFVSNYNVWNVRSSSSYNLIGLILSTEYPTLSDWKTAIGGPYDQNSKDVNPAFLDIFSDNYTPTEQALNGIGDNIGITTDINDVSRIVAAPDPGAIEFSNEPCTSPPNPGVAIVDVNTPVCPGTTIHLNLSGNSFGVNQSYQWQFSNDFAGTYVNVGPVQFTPDYETVSPNATGYFRAAVVCSGATEYSVPVLVEAPLPFSGTYSINATLATGGNNFQSFADAYNAMKCGINGPVVFNVTAGSGPYNEQLIIPYINGMSSVNTITFHGNGEILTFSGTSSTERAVIKLNGAKYVTIDSLVIVPTATPSSTTYNYGVHILNDADHNTIKSCLINVTTNSTLSNNSGIIINSSHTGNYATVGNSMCDSNLLMNNTIIGGFAAVAIMGDAATYRVYGNKVINNTISDFYSYGINLGGNIGTVVEGNDISRLSRNTVTTFYGINISDSCNNTLISKNKIHDPFAANTTSSSAAYGVRLVGDADPGQENIVVNNAIYNFANAGTQNGILNNGSDNARYYHNTISLDDASATCTSCGTRGIYVQSAGTTGVDIRNNMITISRGGTGDRQALYFVPASVGGFTIDNNVYYLQSSATVNAIAYVGGTNFATLLAWQNATGKDLNGFYADPVYANAALGDLTPTNAVVDNLGVYVGITTDINNVLRNGTSPDVGAFEFSSALIQYIFIGTGNWDVPANWSNMTIPPANLPAGSEIIINHAVDGECVLNVPQTLQPGSKLTVLPFKNFRVNGNLEINN